jgi:hypothetical protein
LLAPFEALEQVDEPHHTRFEALAYPAARRTGGRTGHQDGLDKESRLRERWRMVGPRPRARGDSASKQPDSSLDADHRALRDRVEVAARHLMANLAVQEARSVNSRTAVGRKLGDACSGTLIELICMIQKTLDNRRKSRIELGRASQAFGSIPALRIHISGR